MSSIIRGDFAKNLTTDMFTQRAESFQRLSLPRLNYNGQPIDETGSQQASQQPGAGQRQPSMDAQDQSYQPSPQQITPPVVEIPDETLSIFYDRAFLRHNFSAI